MIKSLTLEHCRNFSKYMAIFSPRTFITGDNGIGKSTILEAIRILSVGKSFRTGRLEELVRFNERYCRIEAVINKNQVVEFFYGNQFEQTEIKDRRLTYQENSVSWTDFLGVFPTVLFTPNELEIVLGGPETRRRYLDSVLWQVDASYRHNQLEFSRVLQERSALLFLIKINRASSDELGPWNELISSLTESIRLARKSYVKYLNNNLEAKLRGQKSRIVINYRHDPRPVEDFTAGEIKLAQNMFGAHRDEVVVEFDDFSARRYASRGQSRLVVAYLKAAEADYLLEKTQNPVTVLLDDAFSELDQPNTLQLLELFDQKHQLILTSASLLALPKTWTTIKL